MPSRKDYEAIAKLIANLRADGYDAETLEVVASGLASYFALDNPAFNRVRFMRACSV